MSVVTRFAPSPTGFLHIGGVRTAIFNWLFARAHGGQFKLRIEDTDRSRSTPEAIEAILAGMAWMDLNHDGDVVFQTANEQRHRAVVQALLDSGNAYRCYCSAAELTEMREAARAEGRSPKYDGRWRDRSAADAPAGVEPAIRFKAPQTGATTLPDAVQGEVTVQNSELDDLIIQRADGTPTYNLAVVVDDHDMGVTHVIRGDDHLNNAFRQAQIYLALGWELPTFAHIPLIHGNDGAKLSKRHGALGVEAYRDLGMLMPAIFNYLLRLGWSHGDDEIISRKQAIDWFGLDAVNRAPSRFDLEKLTSVNAHYLKALTPEEALAALETFTSAPSADAAKPRLIAGMAGLLDRSSTLDELNQQAEIYRTQPPFDLDEKAAKALDAPAREIMNNLAAVLAQLDDWTEESINQAIKAFCGEQGLKVGKVFMPLRVALVGVTNAPSSPQIAYALGKQETLARLALL